MPCCVAALAAAPLSVMQKGRIRQGDKHDYMAYAAAQSATDPFIQRDGEMYPESRKDHDGLGCSGPIMRWRSRGISWVTALSEGAASIPSSSSTPPPG